MKKLMNKNFIQKIVIAILIVLSFNFVVPTFSRADFGGVLLGPVIDLIAGIGDCVMALLQSFMDVVVYQSTDSTTLVWTEAVIAEYNRVVDKSGNTHVPIDKRFYTDGSLKWVADIDVANFDRGWFGVSTIALPTVSYSPEKIFSNKVPALDANFINPKDFESQDKNDKSIAYQLRTIISSWYQGLRNLVIVCLLSVLLYVAIRIIISSTASDKAKYKQMIKDWLIALCLLFFLHYIMLFTMTLVEIITDGLSTSTEINMRLLHADGDKTLEMKTNLIGLCRTQVQYKDLGQRVIYLIFYIALVVYTVKFTWEYMKRTITMAFLTLISPLVVLTYPIDKIGDGKAQAFNMWLKEYIFNALLQPFHLIVYTIFVGSAMDIIKVNPLYAIFCLAFISPAEKLLRKFFGFDKASTAGSSFAGGFGGAAAFNAMKNAVSRGTKAISSTAKSGSKGANNSNIRQQRQIKDPNAAKGNLKSVASSYQDNGTAEPEANLGNRIPAGQKGDSVLNSAQERLEELRAEGFGKGDAEYDMAQNEVSRLQAKQNTFDGNDTRALSRLTSGGNNRTKEIKRASNSKLRRTIRGVGKVAGRGLISGAKFTGKIAGKALAAGTMGIVGLGVGIAGDNLEDVVKYGIAGAGLGYTMAPSIARGVTGAIGKTKQLGQNIRSTYEEGAYGRIEAQLRQQERDAYSSKELREEEKEAFEKDNGRNPTRKELNDRMRVVADYRNAGITDSSDIHKGMKLEEEIKKELGEGIPEDEREKNARLQVHDIIKYANTIDAKNLMNANKAEGYQTDITNRFLKAGMDKKTATNAAIKTLDRVKKVKGIE